MFGQTHHHVELLRVYRTIRLLTHSEPYKELYAVYIVDLLCQTGAQLFYHHHQPNDPATWVQVFVMDSTLMRTCRTHHAGPVQIGS
jgi:hypothetical protein